jgi:uncharacterized protein YqeY
MSTELINRIKKDRLFATKNSDEALKNFLGVILGELDRNRGTKELDDAVLTAVINKIRSSSKENILLCSKSGGDVTEFNYQIEVLNRYVEEIKLLSEEETRYEIEKVIAAGANNIGSVMQAVAKLPFPIDKAIASKLARELLGK